MRGFKFVSGNDWWANPQAPWNQPDATYETCKLCGGVGGFWCNEDGVELAQEEYDLLNDDEKSEFEFVECEKCDGVGTIMI